MTTEELLGSEVQGTGLVLSDGAEDVYRTLKSVCDGPSAPSPQVLVDKAGRLRQENAGESLKAFLIRLNAYQLAPLGVSDAETRDCSQGLSWTLGLASGGDLRLVVATAVVEDVVLLMLKHGTVESLRPIVASLRDIIECAPTTSEPERSLARASVANLEYDLELEIIRWQQVTSPATRLQRLRALQSFLISTVIPATDAASVAFPQPFATRKLNNMSRQLSLDFSIAREEGAALRSRLHRWTDLSNDYEKAGDKGNAARCLVSGLEEYLLATPAEVTTRDPGPLRRVLAHLTRLDYRLGLPPLEHWKEDVVIAQCLLRLGETDSVHRMVIEAHATCEHSLGQCRDDVSRSQVLSAAEDWLGICLALDLRVTSPRAPGQRYRSFRRMLRGRSHPFEAPHSVPMVHSLLHRTGAAIGIGASSGRPWIQLRGIEPIVAVLEALHQLGWSHVQDYRDRRNPASREHEWELRLRQLAGRLGLPAVRDVLVEDVRVSSEFPDLPLLAATLAVASPRSVLGLRPMSLSAPPTAPLAEEPLHFLDGFSRGEYLSSSFATLAASCGGSLVSCRTPEEFRAALSQPARLLVLGCHGTQRTQLARLCLSLDGTEYPAQKLLEGLVLPRRSAAIALTCFGGGGRMNALQESDSVIDLLLRAGAVAVVANRWPAWVDPEVVAGMKVLCKAVASAAPSLNVVAMARATMDLVLALRNSRVSPAWWAGWNSWTAT